MCYEISTNLFHNVLRLGLSKVPALAIQNKYHSSQSIMNFRRSFTMQRHTLESKTSLNRLIGSIF